MLRYYRTIVRLLLLISIPLSGQAMAQSTIFNIPTTDTVAQRKAYAEFDFLVQAPKRIFPGLIYTIPAWWSERPAISNLA